MGLPTPGWIFLVVCAITPLHTIFITAYPQIQLLYIDIPLPNLTPIGIVALIGMPTFIGAGAIAKRM